LSRNACRDIIDYLMQIREPTRDDLDAIKITTTGELHLQGMIPNSELITHLKSDERRKLLPLLRRKTTRTISGVTVVAAMTKPMPCPHDGPCAYCPGGPAKGVPQSYTGYEPAAMRGIQNEYDPQKQVESRLKQLVAIGHEVDKVELIIMGGTFPSAPQEYQEGFVKGCLDALIGRNTGSLEEAKELAETSKIRNVGITVETRPDWAKRTHIDRILSMGVTRVELGVQNIYDSIYQDLSRGHTVDDVIDSTRMLKDSGLKVLYHLMPGLPGSNFEKDLTGFKKIFTDPRFKPDMIKIYPCLVLRGTKIYDWWMKGEYVPYSTEEAVRLVADLKKAVPPWVRVMRIQRDIPANLVVAGVKKSNLRQLVMKKLLQEESRCRCIRCREAGHRWVKDKDKADPEEVEVSSATEEASEGFDVFVSAEDPKKDILIGYLRLRIPSEKAHRSEIACKSASVVRELHVCGSLVPVGKRRAEAWQHKGYGATLLKEAERISREVYDRRKVVVISALGTKRYYSRFGYKRDGVYMSKTLRE
jgi:elongator complex protein 3